MVIQLLVMHLVVTVVAVATVSWWAIRRLGTGAAIWWIGGATFVVAQILRMPLLSGVQLAGASVAVMMVLAVVTSGLFEEGARFVALRWVVRRARTAADGVTFGLGHGGIEAVLLIGLSVVSSIVLVIGGDAILDATAAAGQEAVEALTEQIEAIEELTLGMVLLSLYERVLAVIAHVAMTLLVLRAVCARRLVWLVAAMALHMVVNGVVVTLATTFGILAAEAGLTVIAVGALLIIRSAWRDQATWFPVRAVDAEPVAPPE